MSNQQDNNQPEKDQLETAHPITHYQQIAQALHSCKDLSEVEATLAPITALPEMQQISLLKALAQEKNIQAADVVQAINAVSSAKDVRKEARRALVRLESNNTYAEWHPPVAPSFSEVIEQSDDDPILAELQSLLSGVEGFLGAPDYANTASSFIEEWSQGNYEEAYDLLASNSPVREGLSREEWAERRNQWSTEAHPDEEQITFISPNEEQEGQRLTGIEAGWSLTFIESPLAATLTELPVATAVFKETGRHWFWTNYTLVEEDGEWRIHSITDKGADALQLSETELEERIEKIVEIATKNLEEEETGPEDDDDDDEDDEDADDLDEDDEEDEEAFEETLTHMEQAIRITAQGMYYNDALIAKAPGKSPQIYEQAFAQAMSVNETERAATYLQQLAARFPEQRGEALRELSFAYNTIAETFIDTDDEEQMERFKDLAEQTLRDAIATDNAPAGYIMLADMLIEYDDHLDEAEELLNKAQILSSDEKEITLIEASLGEIFQIRNQPEQALKHYQKVADLSPDFPDIWFNIGSLYHQLHRPNEAIPHLQRSITASPSQTGAYAELGAIYTEQQETGKAREILKAGLEVAPDAADLLSVMSLTYIQSGDLRTAEKYLERAEDTDEDHDLVHAIRQLFNEQKAQQRSGPKPKFKQHKKKK